MPARKRGTSVSETAFYASVTFHKDTIKQKNEQINACLFSIIGKSLPLRIKTKAAKDVSLLPHVSVFQTRRTHLLFPVALVGNGEFLTSSCTTRCQYATSVLCGHSLAEAVFVHSSSVVRLKCSFHFTYLFYLLFVQMVWGAKLVISFYITKDYLAFSSF